MSLKRNSKEARPGFSDPGRAVVMQGLRTGGNSVSKAPVDLPYVAYGPPDGPGSGVSVNKFIIMT